MEAHATGGLVRRQAGAWRAVPASDLAAAAGAFLELYGDRSVVGDAPADVMGDGDGAQRLANLMAAAGYRDDPEGFFAELEAALGGGRVAPLRVGGVPVPDAMVQALLECWLPGDDVLDVRSLRRLEQVVGRAVPPERRRDMLRVLERYPVRLSMHTVRQARLSPAVAWQYLPFVEELDPDGLVHTWVGQFHHGVVERMYRNRAIFVLNMTCPVYCRFCFRKHKQCRAEAPPTRRDVLEAVAYVRSQPEVKEVVLTGGDPFMNRSTLTCAVDGLAQVPHVETLRLATRSLSYHPALFTARGGFWMEYLKRTQSALGQRGKRLEVATHFIHPDELSLASLELIAELSAAGITVYVQTPLLGGCNDDPDVMATLFRRLRAAGAEMHYVFMPCSPLQGNGRYRTTVAAGLSLAVKLRARLSDRAMPKFCTATSIGKIDWGASGWVAGEDEADRRFVWIRTPYTPATFASFAAAPPLGDEVRLNDEGTLDARFRVELGDRRWLASGAPAPARIRRGGGAAESRLFRRALGTLRRQLAAQPGGWGPPSGSAAGLYRCHPTRVEMDLGRSGEERRRILDAIAADPAVSDVVVFGKRDPARCLRAVEEVCGRLAPVVHITSVRLRSQALVTEPGAFSDGVLRRLGQLNRPGVVRPLRLEVESLLLHPDELTPAVEDAARRLRRRGVTVTATVPLLRGVNDRPDTLLELAGRCRRAGIEVHQVVVGGLPVQRAWSQRRPVRLSDVTALASEMRRLGSGRELPRWVLWTSFGEAHVGLDAEVVETDGRRRTAFRLRAYRSASSRSGGGTAADAAVVWLDGVVPG